MKLHGSATVRALVPLSTQRRQWAGTASGFDFIGRVIHFTDDILAFMQLNDFSDTAKTCLDAGAAMLHLHIRDAQGHHSLDLDGYRETAKVDHAGLAAFFGELAALRTMTRSSSATWPTCSARWPCAQRG